MGGQVETQQERKVNKGAGRRSMEEGGAGLSVESLLTR